MDHQVNYKSKHTFRMSLISVCAVAVVCAAAVACKSTGGRSDVKIVGGRADASSFPATVALAAVTASDDLLIYCTGTFVRDDLLVTAAHCTTAPGTAKFVLFGKVAHWQGQRPSSSLYTVHPDFSIEEPSPRPTDIAFIHLPRGTATSDMIATIAVEEDWSEQPVTMVGYGGSEPSWKWDLLGVRRLGKNQIAGFWYGGPYRMIKLNTEQPVNPSDNAAINEGDSGGPLYNHRGELVGIGQSGRLLEDKGYWDTRFIDLQVPRIARFVKAEFADQNQVVDLRQAKPSAALVDSGSALSRCVENNGMGHGPMVACGTRKCAKKEADLRDACMIWPTLGGREFCVRNVGRGFGSIFNCSGQRCAKNDREEKRECVLLGFIE